MFKKLLVTGLLVSASASAWAQSGQLGTFQLLGNPTGASAPSRPSNVGSFLTAGTGLSISGTPKATIGIANQLTAAGPLGSATQTPIITYNAQGQLTVVTLATIAPPFSAITGSLACSQHPALTGDTTTPAGSCAATTVKLNGIAFGAVAAVDTIPVITTANTTATYTALPNCPTGILQYTTSTHLFNCGVAGTGTVTSVTAAGIVTASTNPIVASGTLNVNATISPQGRITLASAIPVMTSTLTNQVNVFFTPYAGNLVPIYDGTNFIPTAFAEVAQGTGDATKSPAAAAASSVYDIFCWIDTGPTNRCTRGPAWTNTTTRSAGTALVRVNGILLNNASITNGPAASRGTYVGTVATNGGAGIDYIFGASASGGTAGYFGVWNAYNRVNVASVVTDSGATYNAGSATTRQARGSVGNQISFVVGLSEDSASATYANEITLTTIVGSLNNTYIGYDSITVASGQRGVAYNPTAASFVVSAFPTYSVTPAIGVHFFAALESGDGTHNNTMDSSSTNALLFNFRM